jgi:hypothetical protein
VGDPRGEPADRGETLGVEELALEIADSRFFVGGRLQPLAPPRLLDGEAAEEHGERHHAEVQRERRPIASRHRLDEGERRVRGALALHHPGLGS